MNNQHRSQNVFAVSHLLISPTEGPPIVGSMRARSTNLTPIVVLQADRRGDKRLLRSWVLLGESRSHQARAAARRESRPAQRDRVRPARILAEDTRHARRTAEEKV